MHRQINYKTMAERTLVRWCHRLDEQVGGKVHRELLLRRAIYSRDYSVNINSGKRTTTVSGTRSSLDPYILRPSVTHGTRKHWCADTRRGWWTEDSSI